MRAWRCGDKRADFVWAVEERVMREKEEWSGLMADKLPDRTFEYITKVLVEEGAKFFEAKKACSDMEKVYAKERLRLLELRRRLRERLGSAEHAEEELCIKEALKLAEKRKRQ
eukprot:1080529-Lingulodinium_polyedra.AAC.1